MIISILARSVKRAPQYCGDCPEADARCYGLMSQIELSGRYGSRRRLRPKIDEATETSRGEPASRRSRIAISALEFTRTRRARPRGPALQSGRLSPLPRALRTVAPQISTPCQRVFPSNCSSGRNIEVDERRDDGLSARADQRLDLVPRNGVGLRHVLGVDLDWNAKLLDQGNDRKSGKRCALTNLSRELLGVPRSVGGEADGVRGIIGVPHIPSGLCRLVLPGKVDSSPGSPKFQRRKA